MLNQSILSDEYIFFSWA